MEFNMASKSQTNFEFIDKAFAKHEYKRPSLIFWNVNGRENNVPVNKNDKNVALVSGCSPVTIKSILSAREITPVEVMMTALNDKRYSCLELELLG